MMAFDAATALIVRHATPDMGGARPIAGAGGAMSGEAAHNLDYNSRAKEWEEKGGIDREPTEEDVRYSELGKQLDYVSRMGDWRHKGEGKMVDCTFFGQHGAVSREEVEADMLRCGGCYMRSLVTVDRRQAEEIGMTTKADFEALLRSTWARSIVGERERTTSGGRKMPAVKGWGVTDNVLDVRWVANYHTDQENNLHCHITTWFENGAKSFDREGWTVSAAATRGQKLMVYREAYREVLRTKVYPEKDLARSVAVAQLKTELGIPLSARERQRIERLSESVGKKVELRRTLDGKGEQAVGKKVEAMRTVYDNGSGRKASYHLLEASAREVHKELREWSIPYKDALEDYRAHVLVQADANGLAVRTDDDPIAMEDVGAKEIVQHIRDRYVMGQMEGLVKARIVPAVEMLASRDGIARALGKEAAHEVFTREGLVKALNTVCKPEQAADALREQGGADRIASQMVDLPAVRASIEKVADMMVSQSRHLPENLPKEKAVEIARESMLSRIKGSLQRDGIRFANQESGKIASHVVREELSRMGRGVIEAATRENGIQLGLTRLESIEVKQAVQDIGRMALDGAHRDDDRMQAAVCQATNIIVSSPAFNVLISRAAEAYAASTGKATDKAVSEIKPRVQHAVENQVVQCAPVVEQMRIEAIASQPAVGYVPPPSLGIGSTAADLVSAIASGLGKEALRKEGRRPSASGREQRYLDIGEERSRGQ